MDLKEVGNRDPRVADRHPWEQARYQIVLSLLQRYVALDPNSRETIIDVGCGDGYVLKNLAKTFSKTECLGVDTGFDESELAVLNANPHVDRLRFYSDVESLLGARTMPIGVVLLLDVLEHVKDDAEFLEGLCHYPCITSETVFVITGPALQWLFTRHDSFLHHYRRYHRSSLSQLLNKASLQAVEMQYLFSALILPRLVKWACEKVGKPSRRPEKGVGDWHAPKWVTEWLTRLLQLDHKLNQISRKCLGLHLPGTSIYAVCKKFV